MLENVENYLYKRFSIKTNRATLKTLFLHFSVLIKFGWKKKCMLNS